MLHRKWQSLFLIGVFTSLSCLDSKTPTQIRQGGSASHDECETEECEEGNFYIFTGGPNSRQKHEVGSYTVNSDAPNISSILWYRESTNQQVHSGQYFDYSSNTWRGHYDTLRVEISGGFAGSPQVAYHSIYILPTGLCDPLDTNENSPDFCHITWPVDSPTQGVQDDQCTFRVNITWPEEGTLFRWYDSPAATNQIGTGNPVTITLPASSFTLFVKAENESWAMKSLQKPITINDENGPHCLAQ
jgi:hypothetical protein